VTRLTGVTISATHVNDIVSSIVSSRFQRLVSEFLDERLNILEIAVSAGQKNVLDLLRCRAIRSERHDGLDLESFVAFERCLGRVVCIRVD
jgi:hypothetical protein